jgi:hypothetical protein
MTTMSAPPAIVTGLPASRASISLDRTYWVGGELEVTVDGPGGTVQKNIGRPWALVGASSNCDVILAEVAGQASLPEKALYLQGTDRGVFFVDLAIASEPEARHGWLGQDPVAVGPYRVSAVLRPPLGDSPSAESSPAANLLAPGSLADIRAVVVLSDGGDRQARIQVGRRLTLIGRSRPSTLRIKHRRISAVHAALYIERDRLWIIDLESLNGVKVNGAPVKAASLGPGETAWLGGSGGGPTITFEGFRTTAQTDDLPDPSPVALDVGSTSLRATVSAAIGNPSVEDRIDPSLGRLMVREKVRQKRRTLAAAAVIVIATAIVGTTGFWAWRQYAGQNSVEDPESEASSSDSVRALFLDD